MQRLLVLGTVLCALACGTTATSTSGGGGSGGTPGGGDGGPGTARLTLHIAGSGDVTSSSPAFDCRADCAQEFAQGTRVTLVAVPDAGSGFSGWAGACSGAAECVVALDQDRDVTATFAPLTPPPPGQARVSVQFTGNGSGRVTSSTGGLDCPGTCSVTVANGTPLTLTAAADSNSTFAGWGGACSGSGVCNLSANGDQTAWANFQANVAPPPPPPVAQHELVVTRTGNGRITSSPAGIDCGTACTAKFDEGTAITLTAAADPGWRLSGFGGACSGASCVVTLASDASVDVTFEVIPPPPPDECAGLAPASVPPPQVFSVPPDGYANECAPGTTDGSGTMMLSTLTNVAPPGNFVFRFVGLDGAVKGSFTDRFDDINTFDPFEQANGFLVARYDNYTPSKEPPASVFTVSPAGVKGPPQYLDGGSFITAATNPVGGAVTAEILTMSGADIVSWDETAHRRWTVHTTMEVRSVGVDRRGATLVLASDNANSGSLRAFWIDPSGVAGADFPVNWTGGVFVPRVGDGFFFYDYVPPLVTSVLPTRPVGTPLAQIDAYATEAKPPPDWLAARAHKELHMVHGGSGYALIDSAGDVASCSQQIEVVAPSGKSCGTASFFIADGACSTGRLTVGYDGTVIQQLPRAMETEPDPNQGAHTCTWRYWPGFFR